MTSANDASDANTLECILRCLEEIKASMNEKEKEEETREERSSVKDLAAAFAAIAVFMASLSATFLQYAQGTFDSRPVGTPDKRTDHVIQAFFLISIFLSLGSTCILGRASVAASSFFVKASGIHSVRGLRRFKSKPTGSKSQDTGGKTDIENLGSQSQNKTRADSRGERGTKLDARQTSSEKQDKDKKAKHARRSEDLLDLSVFPLAYSALTFLVGLLVFVWVEQAQSVSISLTVTLWVVLSLAYGGFPGPDSEGQSEGEVQNKDDSGRGETKTPIVP